MRCCLGTPIFGDIELIGKRPIIKNLNKIGVIGMNEDKDTVVIKVGLHKRKNILKITFSLLVPRWNIRVSGDY